MAEFKLMLVCPVCGWQVPEPSYSGVPYRHWFMCPWCFTWHWVDEEKVDG